MPPAIEQPPVVVIETVSPELAVAATGNAELNAALPGACVVTVIVWLSFVVVTTGEEDNAAAALEPSFDVDKNVEEPAVLGAVALPYVIVNCFVPFAQFMFTVITLLETDERLAEVQLIFATLM
jgi:hypothetical protein